MLLCKSSASERPGNLLLIQADYRFFLMKFND